MTVPYDPDYEEAVVPPVAPKIFFSSGLPYMPDRPPRFPSTEKVEKQKPEVVLADGRIVGPEE